LRVSLTSLPHNSDTKYDIAVSLSLFSYFYFFVLPLILSYSSLHVCCIIWPVLCLQQTYFDAAFIQMVPSAITCNQERLWGIFLRKN